MGIKLKYRIKKIESPFSKEYYVSQYKIFGLWLNINHMGSGRFTCEKSTICETINVAKQRIKLHKVNMIRAEDYINRFSHVVWEDDKENK